MFDLEILSRELTGSQVEKTMSMDNAENLPRLSQRVAKNSAVVLLGQVLSLAANLGTSVLLARYLGKDGFGLFSYAIVFVSFFAMLADFGMQAILVREFSRNQWSTAEILGHAVLIKVALSITASALTILVAWLAGYTSVLFKIIVILALNLLVTSKLLTLRTVFEAPFNAALRMEMPILSQLLDGLLLVGITYGLVHSGASLEVLVIGYTLSNLPGLFLIVVAAVRRFAWRFTINRDLIRFLLRESLPLLLYSVLMTLFGGIDVFLLKTFQGESGVGLYAAAQRLTSPLIFIPQVIVTSLFPLLSRYHEESDEKLIRTFQLGMKSTLLVALTLAIATTAWGAEVIRLLYSSEYETSTSALIILMWSQVFLFMVFFFANALTSVNRQKTIFYAAATMLVINIVANLVMIPRLGIQGAAIAKFMASIGGFAVLLAVSNKIFTIRLEQVVGRIAIFCILFALGLGLMSRLEFGVSLVLGCGMFPILVLMSGVFNKDERAAFKSVIPNSSFRR